MDYQLKIPESQPMREQLEKAITDLLTFVQAGTIYISNNGDGYLPIIITFILKKNCGQSGDTLEKMSKKITVSYPNFIFKFINAFRASQGFEQGFPYLIRHCTVNELVYYQPDNKLFYPLNQDVKELMQSAKFSFDDKLKDIRYNFQTTSAHFKNNNNKEAGYFMCIAFWDLYCCYSWFLIGEIGKDIGRPSLLYEYKMVVTFVPHLKEILDYDIPEDKEIINRLSTAYIYYRENTAIKEIDLAFFERAKLKFELLEKELLGLFSGYKKHFKLKMRQFRNQTFLGQSILTKKFRTNYLIEHALSEISEVITYFLKTRAVYCFGYSRINSDEDGKIRKAYSKHLPRYHFYVLVLSSEYKENAVPLLQSLIKKQFENRYTLTLLIHRVKNLSSQSNNQKYFLDKVISNGFLAYSGILHQVYPINADAQMDLEFTRNYWKNRMLVAEQFLMTAKQCTESNEALIKNALIQQSVQQISIALLDLFLGYHPSIYSIPYMFRLLECIVEVNMPFTDSEQDIKLKQLLSANIDVIKHKDLNRESIEESNLLYAKCEVFYNDMCVLGYQEFQRLDNLESQTNVS